MRGEEQQTGSYAVLLADLQPGQNVVVCHSGVKKAVVYHLGEVIEVDGQRRWSGV